MAAGTSCLNTSSRRVRVAKMEALEEAEQRQDHKASRRRGHGVLEFIGRERPLNAGRKFWVLVAQIVGMSR